MTQILCAIDDTKPSENAADFAISLASQLSAGLVFYMVNPAIPSRLRGIPAHLWTDNYIRGHLDEALRRARQAGLQRVSCETHRATSVASAIVTCADLYEADLIVVGASSQRRIFDFLRRTVSRAVADTASCPVLIVRHVPRQWSRRRPSPQNRWATGGNNITPLIKGGSKPNHLPPPALEHDQRDCRSKPGAGPAV
jgi:nucleotide-binding universal stress UspA family protein